MKTITFIALSFCFLLAGCTQTEQPEPGPTPQPPSVISVASVSISQPSIEMLVGENVQLKADVQPSNASYKSLTWASSKQSVAKVSDAGLVTAIAEGSATITVSAGGKSATCSVTVSKNVIPVESITLDKTSVEMTLGNTFTLTATVTPADATDKTITWTSSDASIVSVDSNGLVATLKEGSSVITASCGGKTAMCAVTVIKAEVPVESISLDKTSVEMTVGKTFTLTATVTPADATDKTITWTSSDASIVSVNGDGFLTALKEGACSITASCGGKMAMCAVTVVKAEVPVESISLDKTSVELTVGNTFTLTATVTPSDATDKTISWTSSDVSIVSVNGDGLLTALKEGACSIMASCSGKTAVCTVTVKNAEVPVASVFLDRMSVSLEVGQTTQLVATVLPDNATDKTLTWNSSDDSIVIVNQSGLMEGVSEGQAVITASAGGKQANCTVSVVANVIPVESVTLDKTFLDMVKGDAAVLIATVLPDNATDKKVTWSSSVSAVARVDQNGIVTAMSSGKAVIMAKAGEKSAVCNVSIVSPVESVSLDKTTLTLEVGQDVNLTATVTPLDATDKTITWSSSDDAVATVNSSGKVVAVKKGQATITAKAGEKTATCLVTVNDVAFGISTTEVSFPGAGGSFQVTVTCSSSYHINSKPDWVNEISVQGKIHSFVVASNPDSQVRSGVIVFCDDEGVCLPCNVKQAAGGTFTVTPVKVELTEEGGTFQVSVACSIGYHINSQPDWITEIQDGVDIQIHVFKAEKNPSENDRSGVIVFCDDQGTCLPCAISQKGLVPDGMDGGTENVNDGNPVKW